MSAPIPVAQTRELQRNEMAACNENTQIMDRAAAGCISCRDPTVKPIANASTSATTPISSFLGLNNNTWFGKEGGKYTGDIIKTTETIPTVSYTCTNKPFKIYDANNKLISQTCDSGETFNTKTGLCDITFLPKVINDGRI